ncbi:MAG TPA: mechanosensitive ion channel [Parvularculaceae bacterium]|nr:mechanosensitive ion channel [Parvularculaceae bacterium]
MFQENTANDQSFDASDLASFAQSALERLTPFLLSALGALAVLVVGLWVAGRIKGLAKRAMKRSARIDDTLSGFLSSLIYYGLVALVVITTLGVFGVPTTSFAAVIGAAGLAIGLALQGTLGNVASGAMILGLRPFNVGDFVETAGESGRVKSITLFTTELATIDNKLVIIPNGKVWDEPITNYTAHGERRVDLVFGIAYSADIDKAFDAIRSIIAEDDRIRADPEPTIAVDSLGDSSVNILCRVWVATDNFFPVKWALTKAVKERFDEAGVGIPFPTRTVIMENNDS